MADRPLADGDCSGRMLTLHMKVCFRLGAVVQLWVAIDCGNRYLTLAGFWAGCPITPEAAVRR